MARVELEAIRKQHEVLLRQGSETSEVDSEVDIDISQVQGFLRTLARAGAGTGDVSERSWLRALINYWASFVNDKIGEFPVIQLHPFDKDTGERISEMLKQERQFTTFFIGSESMVEPAKPPETEKEFTEWYHTLGDYEQYYVLTAAVLHGAPVHEVAKRADSLYQFIRDEVERRGTSLWSRSHQGDQWETQQRESSRFSDPLLRTISGRDLRTITYTRTRKERGVARLYWQDADAYGLSTFGLHLLEFLCNEFISRGEIGQIFLNTLQQWSEESTDEVSGKAAYSYGVILWCHDADQLQKMAERWAKEYGPRRTAELLDGAYEIYRVKSVEKVSDAGTPSVVLDLLKSWVKRIHRVVSTDEDENSIEEAIKLGCAVASTYALIGKRSPDIAFEGLERLLRLPLSNSTIDMRAVFAAGVSTYVILTWSGRVRDVLAQLAASAKQLSHRRNLPRKTEKRQEYRRQREAYLEAILEAFFRVAAESLTEMRDSQTLHYNLSEPLPPQPAIPDPVGRDVLLAFLLSRSEVKCQEYIMTLLCTAIVERKSKHAFGLLRSWAEIVLTMRGTHDKDAEETYVTFLHFIVNLGRTIDKWCHDLQEQGLYSPPAVEAFKNSLKQWCTEGRFYSRPIGSFAKEVLNQLSD